MGVQLRVELLASGTNCFVIRGGVTLLCVSLRVYNDSQQRASTVSRITFALRVGRRWKTLLPYAVEEAAIFRSLVRNALPMEIPPMSSEDFYEIYQYPDLVSRTIATIRLRVADYSGAGGSLEDTLSLRLDTRPPLDVLFQTLDIA